MTHPIQYNRGSGDRQKERKKELHMSFLFSPEPPKHAAPTRNRIGGATQQEPDALLYRLAHGPHRRLPVPHVRTRLRERIRAEPGMLKVAFVDGGLARAA